jgi:LysM repeat protein
MRPTLLLATLSMVFASNELSAQSELESLRARCAEQERQIEQLEQENSKLRASTTNSLPPSEPSETSSKPTPPTEPTATYTVKPGDSFEKIARKTSTSVANLVKWNRLKSNSIIQPGQTLKIAQAAATTAAPTKNESTTTGTGRTYQIQNGDTFSSIARSQNISVASLIAANPSVKPSALRIGQTIQLDSGEAAPTSTNPPTTPELDTETAAPSAPTAASLPKITHAAANTQEPANSDQEIAATSEDQKFRTVTIDAEITYGDFASKYGTDIERLNALNGLDLINTTVLAKGSELYIPAQPQAP